VAPTSSNAWRPTAGIASVQGGHRRYKTPPRKGGSRRGPVERGCADKDPEKHLGAGAIAGGKTDALRRCSSKKARRATVLCPRSARLRGRGKSAAEAKKLIAEAVSLHLEGLREDGFADTRARHGMRSTRSLIPPSRARTLPCRPGSFVGLAYNDHGHPRGRASKCTPIPWTSRALSDCSAP